jgi:hypothetical protein
MYAQLYGVPHGILQVCINILYENVFQNPELFPSQISLYRKKSTLVMAFFWKIESFIFRLQLLWSRICCTYPILQYTC